MVNFFYSKIMLYVNFPHMFNFKKITVNMINVLQKKFLNFYVIEANTILTKILIIQLNFIIQGWISIKKFRIRKFSSELLGLFPMAISLSRQI